jgi:hypothetical protein
MSSNNQLIIVEKGKLLYIYENPCVDNDWKPNKNDLLTTKETLHSAVEWVENYCRENLVEYGYRVILEEKEK